MKSCQLSRIKFKLIPLILALSVSLSNVPALVAEDSAANVELDSQLVLQETLEDLRRSDIKENALRVGQYIPHFTLPDAVGGSFVSGDALKNGPLVIVFYRGGWCPYCSLHLRAMQMHLAEIRQLGASLVAISPQAPDAGISLAERNALKFPVLSDKSSALAKRFGIVFQLSPKLKKVFQGFGVNLEELNAAKEWSLPLPATYLVDSDGRVSYAFVEEDYKIRPEPSVVLEALRKLQKE